MLDREQAIKLKESRWWKKVSKEQAALFQLNQERLCMPFGVFHHCVERLLGRSIFDCEFSDPKALIDECDGEVPTPNVQQIIEEAGITMEFINVEASHGKPAQKFTYKRIEED